MDNCCTRVYLLRHGEIENFKGIFKFNSQNDVDVISKGEEQLALQVQWLEEKSIKAVYCSDLIRARKRAKAIASALAGNIAEQTPEGDKCRALGDPLQRRGHR